MNRFNYSSFVSNNTMSNESASSVRVHKVQGSMSVDDMFAELEGYAQRGISERVTYESVGMTAEDFL